MSHATSRAATQLRPTRLHIAIAASLCGCGAHAASSAPPATHAVASTPRAPAAVAAPRADALSSMEREPCVAGAAPSDVEAIDLNGDGRADVRRVRRAGVVICRESDLDLDGVVDTVRFLGADGGTLREESAFDGDGKPDRIARYRAGQIETVVLDTDGDGLGDVLERYEGGQRVERRRDTDADGVFESVMP